MPQKKQKLIKQKNKIFLKKYRAEDASLLKIFAIILMLALEVTFVALGMMLQIAEKNTPNNSLSTNQTTFTNEKKDATIQTPEVIEENKKTAEEAKAKEIPPSIYCRTDADCATIFATCSCSYACVNPKQYGSTKHVSCSNVCTDQDLQNTVSCLCRNNTCVKN